jgi:Domain of unknown function (DUF4132)
LAKRPEFEAFTCSPDDPLAIAHQAVSAWVEDALASIGQHGHWWQVDLKSLPSGRRLLDGQPGQSRRFVLAAIVQSRHWAGQIERIRDCATDEIQRHNVAILPGFPPVHGRLAQTNAVVWAMLRRHLPLEKEDLIELVQWCGADEYNSPNTTPIGSIVRALQRYGAGTAIDPELREVLRSFVLRLRSSHNTEASRLATAVEQLCVEAAGGPTADPGPAVGVRPAPAPTPAGSRGVLDRLKRHHGMLPDDAAPSPTEIGPDRFPLSADSLLCREHELLSAVLEQAVKKYGAASYRIKLEGLESGRTLLGLEPPDMGAAILAAAERHTHARLEPVSEHTEPRVLPARFATRFVLSALLTSRFELRREGLFDLLLYLATRPALERLDPGRIVLDLIAQAEGEAAASPLTEGERYVLWSLRASTIAGPPLGAPSELVARITRLIGDGAVFYLVPGEAWTDAVNVDLAGPEAARQARWADLLRHALTATAARPSAKWLATARRLAEAVGPDDVRKALLRWLPLVARGGTVSRLGSYAGDVRGADHPMNDENANCLRGLLWSVQVLPRPDELTRAITSVALSAYKKVPGVGPRAVKVGNAAIYALSEMGSTDAVGQLAMLKVRVKFAAAQKEIEKAFTAAAGARGLPREQIEEMGVPSYGLEEVGLRRESLGDDRAELVVNGSEAGLRWFDAQGKPMKSVPARVKADHKDELKELQQSLKDIQSMLPVQRDRLDGLFLQRKTWPFSEWRDQYVDHPLVGTIARRLIWCVDGAPALFADGQATDAQGEPIAHGQAAEITLWHPVGRGVDEITSWRRRLEELGITQPFKQAHREVYVLTHAERNTRTYSNRFAAHIIRQHQFHALCAARGWKNKLRLMVDDSFPPATRELPRWGLRAEFWIEGAGDGYGTDTNEIGVYLRLATDQVRFYRIEAAQNEAHAGGGGYESRVAGPGAGRVNEPMPLEEVPALVFSEVMRDVDLFVGVASVGNDPTWQDGGPQGRYRRYWHDYSFGELSGTATTRKQVLERLIPRLRIADRCSFTDRFLIVRGQKRTYKIHLGSGNILMEPNDQYLCIVPDSRSRTTQDELFLPFEGDATLSIIISKALLLADDTRIKDPTITQQIDRR